MSYFFFFFQAEDGIRDLTVTGVQTCALPISPVTGRGLRGRPPAARLESPRRALDRQAANADAGPARARPGTPPRRTTSRSCPRDRAGWRGDPWRAGERCRTRLRRAP